MSITRAQGELFLNLWAPLPTYYWMQLSLFTVGSPHALRMHGFAQWALARDWTSCLLSSDLLNWEEIHFPGGLSWQRWGWKYGVWLPSRFSFGDQVELSLQVDRHSRSFQLFYEFPIVISVPWQNWDSKGYLLSYKNLLIKGICHIRA